MKFNIKYYKKDLNSIKKAYSVYRQLRKGGISKKDIFWNTEGICDMTLNCKLTRESVHCAWGENKVAKINYKEVFDYFFVDVGYEGKYGLNAQLFGN